MMNEEKLRLILKKIVENIEALEEALSEHEHTSDNRAVITGVVRKRYQSCYEPVYSREIDEAFNIETKE